jgi:hypothetical protein
MKSVRIPRLLRKSSFADRPFPKQPLGFGASAPGQRYPQDCPYPEDAAGVLAEPLGAPLSIKETAKLIGCSAWTVRQRHLPKGLPHHRASPNGKLIFYRNQIIRWLLRQQQKGT